MVALPCCHVTLSGSKPKNPAYPAELNTIGDHLRKRRLDLGLLQKEVAGQLGVTTCTIMYWETNRVSPAIRFIPLINGFLGYDPTDKANPQSLAEGLRAHRKRLGLSQKKLATLLAIDQSTLASWEREKHRPTMKSLQLVDEFLCEPDKLMGQAASKRG
jgi:transcriptional regulator with XRE-family HTH domain